MRYLNNIKLYALGKTLGYEHPFMEEKYVIEHPDIAKYVDSGIRHYWFSHGYSDGQGKKRTELGV